MKVLLSPLLVIALALQAAGSLGGVVFCRALGERRADCCCPDDASASPAAVVRASCCDVLSGVAPASAPQALGPGLEKVPARGTLAQDVALPSPSLTLAASRPGLLAPGGASGPPRQAPVYLSLKLLLL